MAIDRTSRFVHLAVKDDETERSAVAFLKEAVRAFPFQVTYVLTDRGSCFAADGFERACQKLGVIHRTKRPYTPRTTDVIDKGFFAPICGILLSRTGDRVAKSRA